MSALRWLQRLALIWGVAMLMLVTSCTAAPDDGSGKAVERRPVPAPVPDPSAYNKAMNQRGAALLQVSWSGDRPVDVTWKVGAGTRNSLRQQPFRNASGQWQGLLAIPVIVQPGDVVTLAADPVYGVGLVIVAVIYLGKDLCDSLPGSNVVKGTATCNVTIP